MATEQSPSESAALSRVIKDAALALGFDRVGLAPVVVGLGAERMRGWLDAGRHGEMGYMEKHREARADPDFILAGARTVVMVALAYRTAEPASPAPGCARISRYAWADDYHDVLRRRLHRLADRLREFDPTVSSRAVVDSAPLMERDYANLAGIGWFGKNTLLLEKRLGSWFFLGALLLDRELAYDVPHQTDHCGSCTRCLDACPTEAFDGPYRLDPRRCISYLTIEHSTPIPESLREGMGDWVFGCDVCQDVCPWNHKATVSADESFAPAEGSNPVDLRTILRLDEEEFRRRFRGTALYRSKRRRLVRNAAIVAGVQRRRELLADLRLLADDPDCGVRDAACWAIERIRSG